MTRNVFRDLGFSEDEAENLKIRADLADLMIELTKLIEALALTQAAPRSQGCVTAHRVDEGKLCAALQAALSRFPDNEEFWEMTNILERGVPWSFKEDGLFSSTWGLGFAEDSGSTTPRTQSPVTAIGNRPGERSDSPPEESLDEDDGFKALQDQVPMEYHPSDPLHYHRRGSFLARPRAKSWWLKPRPRNILAIRIEGLWCLGRSAQGNPA